MADFANLTEYTQRKSGDEIAVARGTGTGRLDLNIATKQTRVASEDLPTPSAALVDEIHNHNGKWFRCIVHPGTPPTVTFGTTYGDGDDVSTLWGEADGTYNFRGRSWTSSVSSPTSGDIVILPDGVFRRYTGSAWVSISTPNHWIGIFTTEFIAKAAAIALDEVASFNNLLAVVTAYAAPVSPEYVWEPQTVTNIVVYSKSRPQAAVENLHTLALSAITREMDLCINEPERSTEATGTWGDIDADAIVETQTIEDVTTYVEDDYYYDIFRDEFFFGTNVGGGTIRPLQDVADDALANSLNNTSNRVVWLHQHDSDEEALQQIPTIETGHEYFYWNRRNRTIRHLTNSTFVAAGSIVAHYKWAPVSGGLQIVDVTGSGGPSVNANNYRSLFVDFISGHVWIGLVRHISGEDPVGTYTDFVHTDFLGVYRDDGAAPDPSETKYFYASGQHGWRVRFYLSAPFTTAYWVWQHINFSQVGLFSSSDVWLGEAADDDALLHRMPDGVDSSDTRRFVGYNRATGKIRLLTNSTYTEAVERHNEYTVILINGKLPRRTEIRAENAAAADTARMARHISLSIPLNQISNEDDVEIILRSSQTGAPIHGPVRLDALRLKTLVVSTLANGASIGATNWTADDAGKYMLFEIARGSNVNGQLFLHDTLYIGRVDNSTLVMWTGASTGKWEYVSVNLIRGG